MCSVLSSEVKVRRVGSVSFDWRPSGSGKWVHGFIQQVFIEHLLCARHS